MSVLSPNLTLLRRACAPCTLKHFCHPAGDGAFPAPETRLSGRLLSVARSSSLFRVGDAQGSVFLVRSGAMKTVVVTSDGEEHVLGFHLPGEMLGLDALASGEHCVEAVALTDTQVCVVQLQALLTRTATMPELNRELLQIVGRTTMDCHMHVDVLMRRQAGERIAMFLHELLQRYQRSGQPGLEMHLPMSREEVAHYLGLALETVSRGFTRLQDDGVIAVAGRAVQILDASELRRIALLPPDDGSEPPLARQA
jgi:CRP/FNR family transcriptional regulator